MAARGQFALLLVGLLVWHHTYVLWHLAGSHHFVSHTPSVGQDASHHHSSHHADERAHQSARSAHDHVHGHDSRKLYGHFGPLVHRLQHKLPGLGLPQAPRDQSHLPVQPDIAAATETSSHSHEKGDEGHGAHRAGDHLAGYYSNPAPVASNLLVWQAAYAPGSDQCPDLRQPYIGRPNARAPPHVS